MQSANDKEKLVEIYNTYRNRMYIAACRILKDPYLSEDAVHEAFIAISRNIHRLGSVGEIKTASYVIKAARNTALNMVKKNSGEIPVLVSEEEIRSEENALDSICSRENYSHIVDCILSLDGRYRDVLSLYYLNELSTKEIAETLSRKESTVKQQLSRGRRKLISLIGKETKENEKESIA